MIHLMSTFIPDHWKTPKWIVWDDKQFYRAARWVYGNLPQAYRVLRLTVGTRILLNKIRAMERAR